MANLSEIKKDSNWGEAASTINSNFQNMNVDLEKVKSATTKFRGYFTSETVLKQKYPSPQVGDTAYVGEPYPGTVYDVQVAGTWHNTGKAPDTEAVDLTEYAKKEEITDVSNSVGLYNVDDNVPLGSGFYTSATARAAVPADVRKIGLIITYKTDEKTSVTEQFTGSDISSWSNEANWSEIGGAKTTNISDDINKIQLAEILDKSTNEGYRIGSTGVETKDSAYNHVSFDALPTDVIIFRGSKAVNIYTRFFLIEKSDGSYESLTVSNQNNNPVSVVEVSLSSYSDIKKVHYNDYASNPIEIYKTSNGMAYYALSQILKDTFANRTNYYQSVVNVLDPEDTEARKDGLYDTNGNFQQSSIYQALTVPVSFGNRYYVVRKDNGKLITISGSTSYPYFLLDKDKNTIGVVKTGNTQSVFINDMRCKFLRFSLASITRDVELGVMTNSTKYSDYGSTSEPNILKDFGEKSNNLFDENNILEKGCLLLNSGYSEQYNMGLIKIPVERGKKYAIFTSNFLDAMYVGIAYFNFDTIGLLTDDNKKLGTVTQIKNLPKNTSGTNCIYTVEETYTVDGETYEGQIYLAMNTKQSQYDITKTIVQEGENITDVHTPYFIRNRVSPSTYTISHIHAGDSISEGTGVSITNIVSDYFRSSFLDVNYFIKNAAVRATAISTAYNWVVNNEEMVKSCNIYSIQYGTNSPMGENAEENAVIPKETFADIPYETDEGMQINTIDEHCARFGNDTYSTYCKFIERVLYLNKKIRLVFISIPEFAENESKHNERVLTNENIKKICKLYSLPYIDAANNAGISYRLTKAYSTDFTHFGNEEGNYLWFTYIATELRKMCNTMFNLEQIQAINENKFNM